MARQAGHPTGLLGRLLARIMAIETAAVNQRVLELLEFEDASRVLEVGFGHGRTLARVAQLAPKGFVAGIDISAVMVPMAQCQNHHPIAEALIEVSVAPALKFHT